MRPLRKCGECRLKEVAPEQIPVYTQEMDHDGRTYQVSVENLNVLKCRNCGAILLDDEANIRLSDALRQAAGLLSPVEIRSQRERLGWTQLQLAAVLKIADSTLSRWERGGQIQQRSMDQHLRLVFNLPEVRAFLNAPPVLVENHPDYSIPTSLIRTAIKNRPVLSHSNSTNWTFESFPSPPLLLKPTG